jgi:chromate transporter
MPGPMFNLCVYVGGIITKNVGGSVVAFVGLYLPCFLFVLFVLPFWENYRKFKKVKAVINGICSSSIGLILSTALLLYK